MLLVINAFNIKGGGGKHLLEYFIKNINVYDLVLIGNTELDLNIKVLNVKKYYSVKSYLGSTVVCNTFLNLESVTILNFGNIPLFLFRRTPQFTIFHRIQLTHQGSFSFKWSDISLKIQKTIIKVLLNKTNWIVQSDLVKLQFKQRFGVCNVFVLPFYDELIPGEQENFAMHKRDIVYFSNGAPHKNHIRLFNAWRLSNKKHGVRLLVSLTQEEFDFLTKGIQPLSGIYNVGWLDREKMIDILRSCRAVIYPSLYESFGLGLIEAVELGCLVYASDLPFVDEIIIPSGKFDPYDVFSIQRTLEKIMWDKVNHTKPRKKVVNQFSKIKGLLYEPNYPKPK